MFLAYLAVIYKTLKLEIYHLWQLSVQQLLDIVKTNQHKKCVFDCSSTFSETITFV